MSVAQVALMPGTAIVESDPDGGSRIENLLFNNRVAVIVICGLVTLLLGWQATRIQLNAKFEDMIPTGHPFVANYLQNKEELRGLFPNAIRVTVENRRGTVFEAEYMEALRRINDDVFLLPGVDRPAMKSLWTSNTRWLAVTEDGLDGGPVIPPNYDKSAKALTQLQANVMRSGEVGLLVAKNLHSSTIFIPLLSKDGDGKDLDYGALSTELEQIRKKYSSDSVRIGITGFAKVQGDLIEGLRSVMAFFGIALLIAAGALYWYTRCWRSTAMVVGCSLVAVLWQVGLLPLLGFKLDPYSVLVPFLVFAIGMSHGAQKMNGIAQDIARGAHRLMAARLTFRRLFLAGLVALVCDAVGFAVLMIIDIHVIRNLALIASIGVTALIVTNLILLPVLLSFVGVNEKAARRSLADTGSTQSVLVRTFSRFTQAREAKMAVVAALVLALVGFAGSLNLKVGDLDPGAPELRANSRYNLDSAFLTGNYGASSDVFAVMVKTPPGQCAQYKVQAKVDGLEAELRQVKGVEGTLSLASLSRQIAMMMNEGNPKWYDLPRTQGLLNSVTNQVPPQLFNETCSMLGLFVYLSDHKAETLTRVVDAASAFAAANNTPEAVFQLAAGNAGIEAATNIVVHEASRAMLWWVYGAVTFLCFITFRSWRAVLCAVLPLMLTSILAEGLMAHLGMGVKVATLPVIALGVGIGVDYALYILSVVLAQMREGKTLAQAYQTALAFTGKVVMLTGFTLATGVATWVLSPIKFQADMGVLLAFMFVWNMAGALILLPALAYFLLRERKMPASYTMQEAR